MTCSGEEAIHVGSASALKPQDVVLAQYREAGILMWRGFTLEQFTNQWSSNDLDLGRGRRGSIPFVSFFFKYCAYNQETCFVKIANSCITGKW